MIKIITESITDAITFVWLLVLVGGDWADLTVEDELEMLDGIEEEIK